MPRKKYRFIPGRENDDVDCFAFYRTKNGKPACNALTDVFCLKSSVKCSFYATPRQAELSRRRAEILRLVRQNSKRR
ncbi:MAG: hypothetical protein LBC78_05770 [Oscillospiraceae bacterium]|jgi:hypothetical protein|nr:hypothetical protein [Oscillospiraceae bacterium]